MNNDHIRSLYSPGFSAMNLSFYKTNLAIGFNPWIPNDSSICGKYDTEKFIVTTISIENTAALYYFAQKIIN